MTPRKKNPVATRANILQHAGLEFCEFGFHAARLNAIVQRAEITKGSLFHHFANKEELCLSWLLETVPSLLETEWLLPLKNNTTPLETIKDIFRKRLHAIELIPQQEFYGSPLAILACSITPGDSALRQAMSTVTQNWHSCLSQTLRQGQKTHKIHVAIQPDDEAYFIIAAAIGIEHQVRSLGLRAGAGFLRSTFAYLDTLRPA